MPSELELLRSLDDEPPTPSTVDVRRAVEEGRRHRKRRTAGYVGAATVTAVAVVGASVVVGGLRGDPRQETVTTGAPEYTIPGIADWHAPAATAPTACTLDLLPVPDGVTMALASGADPTGAYIVGRSYPTSGGYQTLLWHDGKATKVALPGDEEASLQDVNSKGTAVGWSFEDDKPVPYVYHGSAVAKLPGAAHGSAYAINDAGAIVGDDSAGAPDDKGAPLVWPSATAAPFRLPMPAGAVNGKATDIDEDGTVVGTIDHNRPYVWFADGTHRELPMPVLDGKPAQSAQVHSIRNGWATGTAGTGEKLAAGGRRPTLVRWNVRTGEVRLPDETALVANAANAQGWQVGTDKQGQAVLVTDAGTVVLPDLAGHEPGALSNSPNTVSDDGLVISGQLDDATATIRAVVWHCH